MVWESVVHERAPRAAESGSWPRPLQVTGIRIAKSHPGMVTHPSGRYVVEFQAVSPDRGIIRKEEHLLTFRREFDAFLQRITRAGARVVHIYPATPLSASFEIGRMLLPKTFEEIHVWERQAPEWKQALRLK